MTLIVSFGNVYRGKELWMVFIENGTCWNILLWEHNYIESFLNLQLVWKHNFWLIKGFIYEIHFSELSIILQCIVCMVYWQPFKVRVKLFYVRIPKGTRYKTFTICCNSVAFQCILTTEGKKIILSPNQGLFILPVFLQCCILELLMYSHIKTVTERAAKAWQVILEQKKRYVIRYLA